MAVDPKLDEMLYKAIRTKHLLRFGYKNQERIVEPHDYGVQNGVIRLFSWQIAGKSSSPIPGWRLMDVSGIRDFKILDQSFPGGREVPGKHHRWDKLFIRVEPANSSSSKAS